MKNMDNNQPEINSIDYIGDHYYLGLGDVTKLDVKNPYEDVYTKDLYQLGKNYIDIITNLDYMHGFVEDFYKVKMLPMQCAIFRELWIRPFPMFIASRGFGKMLPAKTPIRVKDGWKNMEDIRVGDSVYGGDGRLCKVTDKTEKQHQLKMYKIYFKDGRTIECCEDHLWKVYDNRRKNKKWITLSTKTMASRYQVNRYSIPLSRPLLNEAEKDLPIGPYSYGKMVAAGEVDELDEIYMFASHTQKMSFLFPVFKDKRDFKTPYKKLAEQLVEMNRSVGLYCTMYNEEGIYRVAVYKTRARLFIEKIEPIASDSGYCIQVNSSDKTYITKDYLVTHNTFMMAIIALTKALLNQNYKVVITGAGFRQSKMIFAYIEKIWNESATLRSICTKNSGPFKNPDRWDFVINNSLITAIPIGNGNTIRGLRANLIIADEFNCLDPMTIIETENGLMRLADYDGSMVYTGDENTPMERPYDFVKTEPIDVYKITTRFGYSFKCSAIHRVFTKDGVKFAKDLTNEDYIDFKNHYEFPKNLYSPELTTAKAKQIGKNIPDDKQYRVPKEILASPREVVLAYISGVFEKHADLMKFQRITKTTLRSNSEQFITDIQVLLKKLGYLSSASFQRGKYVLVVNSENTVDLVQELSILDWKECVNYVKFRGRNYDDFIQVVRVEKLAEKKVLYDISLKETHAFYGNGLRQHNSINPEIYESVVQGFASVSQDPHKNVQEAARRKYLQSINRWQDVNQEIYDARQGNQSILSGTAGYYFEHFAQYWQKYKDIVTSGGDAELLEGARRNIDGSVNENMNWKDYSVVRIPYELIPESFMDEKQIARAKATVHSGIFMMEYCACFAKDSEGFFKRTLIESCIATELNVEKWNIDYCEKTFDATIRGAYKGRYIYGIDPASESDNFSIVILEQHKNHNRVVYCWTINKKKLQKDISSDEDYYAYCVKKIRSLMRVFPCSKMAIDTQGGGYAIIEGLHDKDKMMEDELAIWPIIDDDKPAVTDDKPGLHIIVPIAFADYEWTSGANHGLRKDMESKTLLFPRHDSLAIGIAAEYDIVNNPDHDNTKKNRYDSLEETLAEIEELKNELCSIVMTATATGRDRWDVPEVKGANGKRVRIRKDRYSALLMANMTARSDLRADAPLSYNYSGGVAGTIKSADPNQKMYNSTWLDFNPLVIKRK